MKQLSQESVNKLSEIKYMGIDLYRYVSEILCLFDFSAEAENNQCFNSVYPDEIKLYIDSDKAQIYIDSFFDSLYESDILFSLSPNRKLINGEMYHTSVDPYIDTVCDMNYIAIELQFGASDSSDIPIHTKKHRKYITNAVLSHYGLSKVNKKDFYSFLDREFFALIEETEHISLYDFQKKNIQSSLLYYLTIRNAFVSFYSDILNVVNPKTICYSHGAMCYMCFLYEAASQRGIPCYEIDHGSYARERVLPPSAAHTDYYLSFSKLTSDISRCNGLENVIPIGKPFVLANSGVPKPNMPIKVVCIISSAEEDLLSIAARLSAELDPNEYTVLYKQHSAEDLTSVNSRALTDGSPNLTIINPAVDVNDIFKISSIIIGERSTALLEALPYAHIKVLIKGRENDDLFLPHHKLGFFNYIIQNEEIIKANDYEEIKEAICKYDIRKTYRPNGDIYWVKDAEVNFRKLMESHIGQ